jgi:hypothetical protein
MRVIADLSDVDIKLGNNGIVLHLADEQGRKRGRLRIGQATIEWIPANGRQGNGRRMPLAEFVEEHLEAIPRH